MPSAASADRCSTRAPATRNTHSASTWYALRDLLQACGVRVPHETTSASLAVLADTLRTAALYVREKVLTAKLDRVRRDLTEGAAQPRASVFWAMLLDAFMASAWENWGHITRTIQRIRALTGEITRLDDLARRLAGAAPVWTTRIVGSRGDEAAAGPAASALTAWEWRRADTWLNAIIGTDDPAT